ncbi:hypothetical protein MPTK1_3g24520 [Marchantia polymorpha subsp. ruderalis]|uniref:WIYLD domain-containing protein n=2 Tax=Marchantia polymorpha TaxID=3197 RepID=A0AAF6B4D3_MARPO|nr:hypothetical protein MARPO_0178s0002 [Marchantia polymorpha]BBN06867.1 hypothetical protein Mp_3g24520 [Marchantia polymorpha subsp. ruderalis]|eukprot:PTQ27948.1 hypothetical protein MARPO_0178s0002 [Marchantia polymorpha]
MVCNCQGVKTFGVIPQSKAPIQPILKRRILMAESSNQGRRHQAFQAMIALGFEWVEVDRALEDLLQFYDFNWDYIEANSYYNLVDWILNRRPILVTNLAYQEKDTQRSEPVITELSRLQALHPILLPLELPVDRSSLAEDEGPEDGRNPPSPVDESQSASKYPVDLDMSPLSRIRVLNPKVKPPMEKEVPIEDTARAQTEHMNSTADLGPSPSHSSSVSVKRLTDPASPDSESKQFDCSSQTDKHISLHESGQRVIPCESSRTELDKGKQISQLTDLEEGGVSQQGVRYRLDSNLTYNPQRNLRFKDRISTEATDHYSSPRFHEMKVTKEYLSDVLTVTGMCFGQITAHSEYSEMQCETFSTFDFEPSTLDTIQVLVREMSHEYFCHTSRASSLSSGSSSGSTSTFISPFEDAESPPESPTVPKP